MQKTGYAVLVIVVSLAFIPINIAVLILLGEKVTWLHVGLITATLAITDVLIILTTGRLRPKKTHDKHTTKSIN